MAPAEDATVMPVFPQKTIAWPGNTVELKIVEPGHRRMYEDLLLSGKRRILAPLARLPGTEPAAPAEECRLHGMGSVLFLQELKEVSEQTGGAVKYVAKHTVTGRANITRLLNPSALLKTNASAESVDYLQAEVVVMEEPEMELLQTDTAKVLISAWEELRMLSASLDEPRLESEQAIKQCILMQSTWQVVHLWERLQVATRTHREKVLVRSAMKEWIEGRQLMGELPQQLPQQLDITSIGMPELLVAAYVRSHSAGGIEMEGDFWEALLHILAASSAEKRRSLLLQWAQEEIKLLRARAGLRDLLG